MATALSLVQSACYEAGLAAPSALVGVSTAETVQYLNLFYATGRDLRSACIWPQLKRKHYVILQPGRRQYPLPADYHAILPPTAFDLQNNWGARGPVTDRSFAESIYGYTTSENRTSFRVFGPDLSAISVQGQFQIDPVPSEADAGQLLAFEYVSRSWLTAPLWVGSTAYTATTHYRSANGNVYRCATSGTSHATNPPSVGAAGIGRDGGVLWRALTTAAWGSTTAYAAGEFVTNGGNLYECVTSGISAGAGGPTGTDEDTAVVDNTAEWLYRVATTWAAELAFGAGDITVSSSKYFKSVTPSSAGEQKTGKVAPTWTSQVPTWRETDGTAAWDYQNTLVYDALITDSDLCLFDDEIMILGLKWRYLQAKRLDFADLQAEYERLKGKARSRWNPLTVISLASPAGASLPNIGEGNFG